MRNPLDVAAIVGSLRRDSYTRRLTEALGRLAGESMRIEIVAIRDLSMYNQDDEEFAPPAWVDVPVAGQTRGRGVVRDP